jgi:hypothetical protein
MGRTIEQQKSRDTEIVHSMMHYLGRMEIKLICDIEDKQKLLEDLRELMRWVQDDDLSTPVERQEKDAKENKYLQDQE